jgi:hypothetical protein
LRCKVVGGPISNAHCLLGKSLAAQFQPGFDVPLRVKRPQGDARRDNRYRPLFEPAR